MDSRYVVTHGANFFKEDEDTPESEREPRMRYLCKEFIKRGCAAQAFCFGRHDSTGEWRPEGFWGVDTGF